MIKITSNESIIMIMIILLNWFIAISQLIKSMKLIIWLNWLIGINE